MRDALGFFKLGFVFLQLPLSLPDYHFCLSLLGDVGHRSDKLAIARCIL